MHVLYGHVIRVHMKASAACAQTCEVHICLYDKVFSCMCTHTHMRACVHKGIYCWIIMYVCEYIYVRVMTALCICIDVFLQ